MIKNRTVEAIFCIVMGTILGYAAASERLAPFQRADARPPAAVEDDSGYCETGKVATSLSYFGERGVGGRDSSLMENSISAHEGGPLTPNPSPPRTGARGEQAQQGSGDSELRKQKAGTDEPPATTGKKPNVVFILVDNIGWGDFGCYGGATPTPRIDALAQSGIRFKNYNVEGQCTATRSAILTGRMPVRTGTYTVPAPGEGVSGLCPWEYTLAEMFSEAGYSTAMYGKWHLGEVTGRLPTEQGFDRWWGIKNSWEEAGYSSYPLFNALIKQSRMLPPQVWEGLKGELSTPAMPLNLETRPFMCQKVTEHTTAYIAERAAAGKPFFAYVGYPEMHPPVMPHPDFLGKSPSGKDKYSEMLREMDYRVGQILDAIQKAGIEDNTIVVLSSDNASGGATAYLGGSNGPWRGNYFTPPFEGSLRVPALIRWPGKIPAHVATDQMFAAVDWLPTLAGLIGDSKLVPTDRPMDGIDASRFMLGRSKTSGRDTFMEFGMESELMCIKWRHYKIVFRYCEGIDKPTLKPRLPLFYDLSSDPHEDHNLNDTKMDCGWLMLPAFKHIEEYEKSVKRFPNIKVSEEFKGYSK